MTAHFNAAHALPVAPVPARSTLVHLNNGKPVTDSLTIAHEFGCQHKNVLQSLDALIADGTINRIEFKPVKFTDAKGQQCRMIELSERGALIAMPFIGGKNARVGQVRLVDAFLALRDLASSQRAIDWHESKRDASASCHLMHHMLQDVRTLAGKETHAHHYANEARLIDWVVFGSFACVARDTLPKSGLAVLDAIIRRNTMLIAAGHTYEDRKAALPVFLAALRAKLAPAMGMKAVTKIEQDAAR